MSEADIVRYSVHQALQIRAARITRVHQKPTAGEIKHYRWRLDQKLKLVQPKLVAALGATRMTDCADDSLLRAAILARLLIAVTLLTAE